MDERIFWGLGLIYSTPKLKGLDINSVTGEAQRSTAYMRPVDNERSCKFDASDSPSIDSHGSLRQAFETGVMMNLIR